MGTLIFVDSQMRATTEDMITIPQRPIVLVIVFKFPIQDGYWLYFYVMQDIEKTTHVPSVF